MRQIREALGDRQLRVGSVVEINQVYVCCSVLHCVVVCCSLLQCTTCVVVCCSVLQCAAVCCSLLQCAAVCCSVLLYQLRVRLVVGIN